MEFFKLILVAVFVGLTWAMLMSLPAAMAVHTIWEDGFPYNPMYIFYGLWTFGAVITFISDPIAE